MDEPMAPDIKKESKWEQRRRKRKERKGKVCLDWQTVVGLGGFIWFYYLPVSMTPSQEWKGKAMYIKKKVGNVECPARAPLGKPQPNLAHGCVPWT